MGKTERNPISKPVVRTPEVVGGVLAGSLTFLGFYELIEVTSGEPSVLAVVGLAGIAASAALAGEVAVYTARQSVKNKKGS